MGIAKPDLRVFLDANVFFSAAYRENAGLAVLWKLQRVHLLTSEYAAQEAVSNLMEQGQQSRLRCFMDSVELTGSDEKTHLISGIELPDKDRPILAAAVTAKANFLLTGDIQHFGRYFGKVICGVCVQRPAEFLKLIAAG